MNNVRMESLVPTDQMSGEDNEATSTLHEMLAEAKSFIKKFKWSGTILEKYFGLGIPGVVAVFLFHVDPITDHDDWLWVIVGDLPSAYLVTDRASDPVSALKVYCELMEDWVQAVRGGGALNDVFPVNAPPDTDHADMLERRIELLRTEIIPSF